MKLSTKFDPIEEKNRIFHDLIEECKHQSPGSRLSYHLRSRLEKHPLEVRSEIANRVKVGCSPLFIACKKGQPEIVEYLLTVCQANVEQKGLYEVYDDRSTHVVTPLWCAAVSGKLSVVEILLRHNADINAVSDTGSTPVRSACFMTHCDIVKVLVAHGADINRPNYNGGTCLINSVQSAELCAFLLAHGANVNARDIQNKTALHYAIQEHRLETTRLLLDHGADFNAKSRYGDDALQMACLKGASMIFNYLTNTIVYTKEKLADAHELMGATFLDEHNDLAMALLFWERAIEMRQQYHLYPKRPVAPPREGYRYQTEFNTVPELNAMSGDLDKIRTQSLMIAERILGTHHKDTIFRLMYRGAAYADTMRFQRCIDLWRRALEIRIQKDSILYTDTCFTAQALVRQMVDFKEKCPPRRECDVRQRFHDIVATFNVVIGDLDYETRRDNEDTNIQSRGKIADRFIDCRELLDVEPRYKRQADFYDKILKCLTHLIYLMTEAAQTEEQNQTIVSQVRRLVCMDPKTLGTGDTILHLCVSRDNTIRSSYFVDEDAIVIFPNMSVIKFLLKCGAKLNVQNKEGSTVLHYATKREHYNDWLVKLLLKYGAHIDQPNQRGICPSQSIMDRNLQSVSDIQVLNHLTLKCMCAHVIVKHKIKYVGNEIPTTLEAFVKLHEQ